MAKSKKTITETLREMDARLRENRMIAAQNRLADEMMLARLRLEEQKVHSEPNEQDGPRVAAAKADLNKLYPCGVSDDISAKQVENELRVLCEKQGRKGHSYETVRRALGRRK
jgi:hypothetical protein